MPSLGIINGRIWTATDARPWASSVVVENGIIAAMDEDRLAASADTVLDARGGFIMPGLIDTHVHLLMAGESLGHLDLSHVRSRDEFECAIAQRHQQMLDEEQHQPATATTHQGTRWLHASGWSQENWGGVMPDKTWLADAGTRPVVAYRMDSHVCLVNDAVLRQCDVSRDPDGGRIERDARGEPTGLMLEAAAWMLVNPRIPSLDQTQKQAALRQAMAHAHAKGLTTVGSMEYQGEVERAYLPQRDHLSLRVRVTLLDRESFPPTHDANALERFFSFAHSFENDDRLAVIGFKTFIDGTLGSRTARLLDPYADEPATRGLLCELAATGRLNEWIHAVASRGWQPAMHAIGDEAARLALDAIESLDPSLARATRPRTEHAQTLHPADITRFRSRIASMQPLHRADDGRYARTRLGDDRMRGFFAFRHLRQAGATLAFGSDWPIVTCDPMLGMRAAVTGCDLDGAPVEQQEALSIDEALHAYTTGAAHALHFEKRIGSIEPGKLADFTWLDRSPFEVDWPRQTPRVMTTIVGGNIIHPGA